MKDEMSRSGACGRCGRPVFTASDLVAWSSRETCHAKGDCRCSACSRLCWASTETLCDAPRSRQARGGTR